MGILNASPVLFWSVSAVFIEKLGNFMPAQGLGLSFWLLENLALFPVLKILENLCLPT
jgi:hypothetical protein